uniref:(northern house mosquito) hypothetical protein n=1 Tax=Culex pipiens TaxID=7175 RepID=A0A8D8G3C1_CULPI
MADDGAAVFADRVDAGGVCAADVRVRGAANVALSHRPGPVQLDQRGISVLSGNLDDGRCPHIVHFVPHVGPSVQTLLRNQRARVRRHVGPVCQPAGDDPGRK